MRRVACVCVGAGAVRWPRALNPEPATTLASTHTPLFTESRSACPRNCSRRDRGSSSRRLGVQHVHLLQFERELGPLWLHAHDRAALGIVRAGDVCVRVDHPGNGVPRRRRTI